MVRSVGIEAVVGGGGVFPISDVMSVVDGLVGELVAALVGVPVPEVVGLSVFVASIIEMVVIELMESVVVLFRSESSPS